MKSLSCFILAFLVLATALIAESEFRTWHMIGGGQFDAKLNAVGTTTITLENHAGTTILYPLADLKPSDQKFARNWQRQQADRSAAATVGEIAERSDFAQRVYTDLVVSKGKRLVSFEAPLSDDPQYFAFYRSAIWCPPCRKFTPKLVDFYKRQKRKGARFELIYISSDRSEEAMAEYMDTYDMPWPAFSFGENKNIVKRNGGGIPSLIITDAKGKKLLDSYTESGDYIGPTQVMETFEEMLKESL